MPYLYCIDMPPTATARVIFFSTAALGNLPNPSPSNRTLCYAKGRPTWSI
jgi:hypothetical protein